MWVGVHAHDGGPGPTLPTFREWNHTPNMLTTYSFATGVLAVGALMANHVAVFALLFLVSYVFDCMDGQMARRYHMTSRFGDLYDHVTDIVVVVGGRAPAERHRASGRDRASSRWSP